MYPRKIAILTDSCADLSPQLAEENHIFVVPLRILCADGEYLDGVNIRGEDVYRRLRAGELPQTSLPATEEILKLLTRIHEEGYDGVIAVMLSGGLSGTYNLLRLVAEECRGKLEVRAFDSGSGSLGLGMTVLQLAEDIQNGMGWEELTERRVPQLLPGGEGGADGLLHRVLRVLVAAQYGLGGPEQGVLMPHDLRAECVFVQHR